MIKLRDLFVKIGFQADAKPLGDIDRGLKRIKQTVKSLTYMFVGSAGLAAGIGYFLKQAGFWEQTEIAFETMLGSAEVGQKLLKDLQEFTMKTPFQLKELLVTSKTLLAMGIASKDILEILKSTGDVAAGLSVPIQHLAHNFGQVKAQAKLTGREVLDFALAGVPLLEIIGKLIKKTVPEVRTLMRAGKISYEQTKEAFRYMSEEGNFQDLMLKQAKTLFGLFSISQDVIFMIAKDIGMELLPAAKQIIKEFIQWTRVNKELLKHDIAKHAKTVGKAMFTAFKFTRLLVNELGILISDFGGFERVLKTVGTMLFLYFGFKTISGIGGILKGVFELTQGFTKLSKAAALAKIFAYLEPLLIGVGFLFILGLMQDIHGYLTGKDSITGLLNDLLRSKFPKVAETLENTFGTIGLIIESTIKSVRLLWLLLGDITTLNYKDFAVHLQELKATWPEAFNTMENVIGIGEATKGYRRPVQDMPGSAFPYRPTGLMFGKKEPIMITAPININIDGFPESYAELIGQKISIELDSVLDYAHKATKPREKR